MSKDYSGQERRRFKRVEVNFTVLYRVNFPLEVRMRIGDREINALALDISEGGMAVLISEDIPLSSIATVKFIMLNENTISTENRTKSIVVQGEVRYHFWMEKEKEYRLGIKFTGLSEDDRNFITNFVKAQG
jgi:c-di-GMP-binding flagellar brake protein YcgR